MDQIQDFIAARAQDLEVARDVLLESWNVGDASAIAALPQNVMITTILALAIPPLLVIVLNRAVRRFVVNALDTAAAVVLIVLLLMMILGLPVGKQGIEISSNNLVSILSGPRWGNAITSKQHEGPFKGGAAHATPAQYFRVLSC